jgi:two-component system, chemotaxis family, CheB/CheR fusion protein
MKSEQPLIVGIGASAGGIAAMEALFRNLPDRAEMAFVIVTHLSPQRESQLHQVVARQTAMPVHIATEGAEVAAGQVYVMPENAVLFMNEGRLRLHELDLVHRERKPVDVFFASLAKDQGENAVGIVLSGGDSDGTLGVKAIKEHGGITMAQLHDGDSGPRNPEMPNSAITSGLIDFALPAEEMGGKLEQLMHGRSLLSDLMRRQETDGSRMRRAQEEISLILSSQAGHDFSGYKSKTFLRRVARRMQVHQLRTIESYMERLRDDPAEVMALFRDLLINVTEFFRDVGAFEKLEHEVMPKIFAAPGADKTVRVWVPGCATGEEVYSLGILLHEQAERLDAPPRIQIFATDIDEPALGVARAARYPEELLKGLSQERRRRFFTRDGGSWVLRKEVRDMCVFSPHSVISDPPFSRMDLVSCRNLLIYLGRELQDQVIPTFHYALKPGGYLFLGTSEGISNHSDLFSPLDKKHRIFQSREHGGSRIRLPMVLEERTARTRHFEDTGGSPAASAYRLRQRVDTQVLDRHVPPHVVVRKEGDIVYYSARTGRFLEPPRGAPSRQLLDMVRREFRLDLRAALRQVMETGEPSRRVNVLIKDRSLGEQLVALEVEPLDRFGESEPLYLVLFTMLGPAPAVPSDAEGGPSGVDSEAELRDMRERLQSTVEEYETALEELKSSSEELVSVNEEVQSTNEELEASKEEMQSLNEELNTVNTELIEKVEELDRANMDLKNLYEATQIATVFLDRMLVVRNFTPAASSFFNLRPSDIGRPLTELASALDYPELHEQIREVFASGEFVEHRLTPNGDGEHYLVRLIPYRDGKDEIGGVLVTLVDVTSLMRAEGQQRVLIAELNHRVKNMLAIVIGIANATLRHSASPATFNETMIGRLHGMARAYTLLSQENWTEIPLPELLSQELQAHGPDAIDANGPDVRLKPQQALAMGLVLHELATNAQKYGSLSKEGGRIDLSWQVTDGAVEMIWHERDGPEVTPPEQRGFGFILIEGQVEQQLQGEFEPQFKPDGLAVRIRFPL